LSYDAGTLAQRAAFSTTIHPNGLANVWQSGCGLSADVDGFIYCATGNGDFTAPGGGHDYANSVLKLTKDLRLADYFCPCNQCHLNASDADLGSGGVLILPDQPGSIRRLLLAGGKEGSIYLLNRSNLGKFNDPHDPHCKGDTTAQYCADAIVQRLWRAVGGGPTNTHARDAIFGGAAYYAGPTGMFVYYAGQDDNLRAFSLLGGRLSPASVMQSSDVYSRPSGDNGGGSTPVVSSDGAKLGTGIVWTIVRAAEGRELVLRAHDAADLTNKLTERNSGTWWIPGTPFLVPTVVNGKVYVATTGMLVVFGLLNLALAFKFRTTRIPRGQSAIGSLVLSGDAEDGVDILLTATDSNGNDVQIDTDRVTLSSARPTTAIAVATQGLPPKTLVDVQASALDGTVFADVILRVV
jgi:hypothetical protein